MLAVFIVATAWTVEGNACVNVRLPVSFNRFLRVIDDEVFERYFFRFQAKSELLLDGCEQGRTVGLKFRLFGSRFIPLQPEIIDAGLAGPVHNGAAYRE